MPGKAGSGRTIRFGGSIYLCRRTCSGGTWVQRGPFRGRSPSKHTRLTGARVKDSSATQRAASEITCSSECHYGWPFYPDRIADQLGIDVHRLVAFLHLSAYLFQTVFPSLFACHPTASYRHPLRVSAGCGESSWMVQVIAGGRPARKPSSSGYV